MYDGRAVDFATRLGFEVFFDFEDHPLPMLITLGLGGGDGYDYGY